MNTDFEVLHAGRVYPDGTDAAALIREQIQRWCREAERQGMTVAVYANPFGGHEVDVERAAS